MDIQNSLHIENYEVLAEQLAGFIREAVAAGGRSGCILGNSGGVDCAVVAFLAVRALGREGLKMLFLPERDSHPQSRSDAHLLAEALDLPLQTIDIAPILRKMGVYKLEPPAGLVPRGIQEKYVEHKHEIHSEPGTTVFLKMLRGGAGSAELRRHNAYYSVKHRLRMSLLYLRAEQDDLLVLGTANKSEKMTGLFIKYGDGACDAAPLANLYKTQVWGLARHLGVPAAIIDKPPTGDLSPGLTDENTLKMDYAHLDPVLAGIELGAAEGDIMQQAGVTAADVAYVRELIEASAPLRRPPLEPGSGPPAMG